MQTSPFTPQELHEPSEADFIPTIAADWQAGRTGDVLIAIAGSALIVAETALYIEEKRGPLFAKRFLEFIRSHSAH